MRRQRALISWTHLLGGALESTSREIVRKKILSDLDLTRLGYNWVATQMLKTKKLKPSQIEETATRHALKTSQGDRVKRLMEGAVQHEALMRGREIPAPKDRF